MAITDIVFFGDVCLTNDRGNIGTLSDINVKDFDDVCLDMNRGNIGTLVDINTWQPVSAKLLANYTFPSQSDVRIGAQYGGSGGTQYTGNLIVGGATSHYATIAKETGANAKNGSGTCGKLTPTSASSYGYWYLYVPTTASTSFVLSFYHKISTSWNGLLKVSIYDTDQTTLLLTSESVTTTDDAAYHQYTASSVTPSTTGMCLVRIEIRDGSTTGHVFIDDIGVT